MWVSLLDSITFAPRASRAASHVLSEQEYSTRPSSATLSPEAMRRWVQMGASTNQPDEQRHGHNNKKLGTTRSRRSRLSRDSQRPHVRRPRQRWVPKTMALWKEAKDPKTGRTYYYHAETRATQWSKPSELATDEERQAMEEKERSQREFFRAMEANILQNLQKKPIPAPAVPKKKAERRMSLVKTISSMDESVLRDLVKKVPSHRNLGKYMDEEDDLFQKKGHLSAISEGMNESGVSWNDSQRRDSDSLGGSRRLEMIKSQEPSIGSLLSSLPEGDLGSTRNEKAQTSLSSIGNFIADLPSGSVSRQQSFYGLAAFEDSNVSMGLNDAETTALSELANLADQMVGVEEDFDGYGKFDGAFDFDDFLGDISEADHEDESEVPLESPAVRHESEKSVEATPRDGKRRSRVPRPDMPRPSSSRVVAGAARLPAQRPGMTRRNTCGTLYVESTLSAPDKDATIKCVCGVYRAHLLQSRLENASVHDKYRLFNDRAHDRVQGARYTDDIEDPTLDEITDFYRGIFQYAKMEADCIIMTLVYVERLVKTTDGALRPQARNWRSVLFSCMILSSKVWDDMSMWNADFSEACPPGVTFSVQRINQLEVAVLSALSYHVKVPASEYAKYYFLLRCMLIKSGLGGDEFTSNPLDVEGARRLQHASYQYQSAVSKSPDKFKTGKSVLGRSQTDTTGRGSRGLVNGARSLGRRAKVSLEHIVQM